jgi:hypothetical protein
MLLRARGFVSPPNAPWSIQSRSGKISLRAVDVVSTGLPAGLPYPAGGDGLMAGSGRNPVATPQ